MVSGRSGYWAEAGVRTPRTRTDASSDRNARAMVTSSRGSDVGIGGALLASRDVDGDPRDEVGVGGGEKADHARLVLGLRDAAQGYALDLARLLLGRHAVPAGAQARAQRQARRDGVDRDAVRAQLERQLAGERDDAALGGGVGGAARGTDAATGDGRDVHDLARALT